MDKPLPPTRSRSSLPVFVLVVAVATFFLVRHGSDWLRRTLIYLSQAAWARSLVSSWSVAWRVASRFVAGVDRDAAVAGTRTLNERGIMVTLDYLGESCTHEGEALQAREEILRLLGDIAAGDLQANVSLKPTQLGLKIDRELAYSNICTLVERAKAVGNFIRIDMEDSPTVDTTLGVYRQLRQDAGPVSYTHLTLPTSDLV